jgi:hypothetical protein
MIVSIENSSMFKKMNRVLVDQYHRQGIVPSILEHQNNFQQAYNVQVIVENSRWSALEFFSEQDAIVSIMKWG